MRDQSEFLAAATRVGERLVVLRKVLGDTWFCARPVALGEWSVRRAELDFYDEVPGIALFMAYLARVSGIADYGRCANESLSFMLRLMADGRCPSRVGLAGRGGLVYVLSHLSCVLERSDASDAAKLLVTRTTRHLAEVRDYDVMRGVAGWLKGAGALYRSTSDSEVFDSVVGSGRLLQRFVGKVANSSSRIEHRLLSTGYSHGASGIADALGCAYEFTGEEAFARSALDCVAYEARAHNRFNPVWKAVAEKEAAATTSTWCHGKVGIGLARLSLLRTIGRLLGANVLRSDLRTCEMAALSSLEAGGGLSLCHGVAGILNFLLELSRSVRPSLRDRVASQSRLLASSLVESNFLGDVAGGDAVVPGLLPGIAGVGYYLLRAMNHAVPDVLSMAGPEGGGLTQYTEL